MRDETDSVRLPITGELDLHTFHPSDLGELIPAWLEASVSAGYNDVRIVHGKGTGTLRETVHALLRRSPWVKSFKPGDALSGSWGATVVFLRPATPAARRRRLHPDFP